MFCRQAPTCVGILYLALRRYDSSRVLIGGAHAGFLRWHVGFFTIDGTRAGASGSLHSAATASMHLMLCQHSKITSTPKLRLEPVPFRLRAWLDIVAQFSVSQGLANLVKVLDRFSRSHNQPSCQKKGKVFVAPKVAAFGVPAIVRSDSERKPLQQPYYGAFPVLRPASHAFVI